MNDFEFWSPARPLQQTATPFVRVAELEIDPARLEEFNSAIQKGIESSLRSEPGVLALYAVSVNNSPSQVLVFEMYRDEAAYNSHRETAHFKKFFEGTREMVKSRNLRDVQPVMLGAKTHWTSSI